MNWEWRERKNVLLLFLVAKHLGSYVITIWFETLGKIITDLLPFSNATKEKRDRLSDFPQRVMKFTYGSLKKKILSNKQFSKNSRKREKTWWLQKAFGFISREANVTPVQACFLFLRLSFCLPFL